LTLSSWWECCAGGERDQRPHLLCVYVPWPMYTLHTWWECCAGDERETRGPICYAYICTMAYVHITYVVGVLLRWGRERDQRPHLVCVYVHMCIRGGSAALGARERPHHRRVHWGVHRGGRHACMYICNGTYVYTYQTSESAFMTPCTLREGGCAYWRIVYVERGCRVRGGDNPA